ncbi:MAG: DUF6600 domain-containing protein [Blastocatellales bacterium]
MKHGLLLIALLIAVICGNANCASHRTAYPRSTAQRVILDISIFYDELAPYGRWFPVDGYGYVWTPYDVAIGWRPYTDGYWVYTDYGWTWVSRYRWGWAPFHYGRWIFHSRHGWVWRPGTVWGPAWVVWRYRPGWIGWAPMPPQMEWRAGVGLRAEWGEVDQIVEPFWYSFVEERHFTARDLDRRLELPARNITLLRQSENVTSYAWAENRVVNRSINIESVEQAIGRPVPRGRVADADSPARVAEVRGNDVLIYRPTIQRETTSRAPRQQPPARRPDSSLDQMRRRDEEEQRKLEIQQARDREALETRQRIERTQTPRQAKTEEINRQHESERRALEIQKQREQQILKNRQEDRRKSQPPVPARREKERKPAPERKPPTRKLDQQESKQTGQS